MTETPDLELGESAALFVTDDELRRRINPKIGRDRFRALIKTLEEKQGFPRIHMLFGGRYWPKVRQWLDNDNQVENHEFAGDVQDGPENFDAETRERTGTKTRPAQVALLDRHSGRRGSDGVSRSLHRVASGR